MHNWKLEIYPDGKQDPETGGTIYIKADTIKESEYPGEWGITTTVAFLIYTKADTMQQAIARGYNIAYNLDRKGELA